MCGRAFHVAQIGKKMFAGEETNIIKVEEGLDA
jgi:hypothetical protein